MLPLDQPLYPVAEIVRKKLGQVYIFKWRYQKQEVLPYYYPTNPRTARQQNLRNYFAYAVSNWQAFDDATKGYYNELSGPNVMSGYNRYLHFYLRANYVPLPVPTTFLDLSDTPSTYDNAGGYAVAVNEAQDGLEFTPAPTYVREKLTADRTYYVRTDGSDSNNGLSNTAGGAFLTIQHAVDVVAALDISIYDVTIQVGSGTYSESVVVNGPWVGSGIVTLTGDTTTPTNVVISINDASNCVTVTGGGRLNISGFQLVNGTFGYALASQFSSFLSVVGNMDFSTAATGHIYVTRNGVAFISTNYTISGGTGFHIGVDLGGQCIVGAATHTLTGTPAFSVAFAYGTVLGGLIHSGVTFSGSATGERYKLSANAAIQTFGGGANYFPGNAAGSTSTGGQYA